MVSAWEYVKTALAAGSCFGFLIGFLCGFFYDTIHDALNALKEVINHTEGVDK